MITILVAEDQLLIQKDICRKIEKTDLDVKIVGTAINGHEAWEKIQELRPDALITDIRMPIQDGLSLIRQIKDEELPVYTIILSGYRDFSYAQEALKLGVNDYMLKPVSIEDLRYVLSTLNEKTTEQKNIQKLTAIKEFLYSATPSIQEYSSYFPYDYYYLMELNLDSFYTLSFQDSMPYKESLEDLLSGTLIPKYLRETEQFFVLNGNSCNQKYILLCLHNLSELQLSILGKDILHHIEDFTQSATLCISNKIYELTSLGMHRQLLEIQLKNQLVFSRSSLLYSGDFLHAHESVTSLLNDHDLKQFRFYIHSKNPEDFLNEMKAFLNLCEQESVTQKILEQDLKKIMAYCFSSMESNKMSNLLLELEEYISNSRTYHELYHSLTLVFERLFQNTVLHTDSSANPEKLVEDIKQYIENNFHHEININDIADHFAITPAYMSRLFKKHSNIKPIEYLMNCRIHQACLFFQESDLTVREIAELCGYSNQYYFSKAFKQMTSFSPSEYRIRFHKT